MNSFMAYSLFLQLDPAQPGPVPGLLDTWSLFVMVFKMCLTLGAVCLLAFLVLRYGLPRMMGLRTPQGKLLKVVTRFQLEPQKSLYIVEVVGKHLLLGVSEQKIEVLSELDSEAVQEALEAEETKDGAMPSAAKLGSNAVKEFSKYLRR